MKFEEAVRTSILRECLKETQRNMGGRRVYKERKEYPRLTGYSQQGIVKLNGGKNSTKVHQMVTRVGYVHAKLHRCD